jgi:hypothetical protein
MAVGYLVKILWKIIKTIKLVVISFSIACLRVAAIIKILRGHAGELRLLIPVKKLILG